MPKPKPLVPLAHLKEIGHDARSVTLQSDDACIQLMVLAPDLFRLRVTRGRRMKAVPSWAVERRTWPEVPVRIERRGDRVTLTTSAGLLELDRRSGGWVLRDRHGLVLFEASAGATGFQGKEPRLTLQLGEGESFFGLGECTGVFNRRGLVREFWNIDVLGHAPAIHPGLKQLYVSIPFTISVRDGRAAGLFWDNPAKQVWDLGQTKLDLWQMSAASGEIDLYLFLGPSASEVVARYTELTGAMPLPPKWGLGYQQCRYSYETAARLLEVAGEFRRRKLPCDVLYLDIHHMDGYRVFTFGKGYPEPARLFRKLAAKGFKVVTIVDPGVKDDSKFGVLRRGIAAEAFVKDAKGKKDFVGEVWPGKARFPDFLNPGTRAWWAEEQQALRRLGVVGFWNDMNEPANFARPDKTLAPDCQHHTEFGIRPHHEVHNLYGMEMARASREGALLPLETRGSTVDPAAQPRPFVITRAGYAGIQRYALVWTGDNSSNWDHLNDAVQMFLNLSVSGVPFCGGDVGGFLDNTTPELFVRWFQFATFTPFFRNHSNLGTIDQEPWALGKPVEEICRGYLHLRYQLLPYLYALFAEARAHGTPIMRPLFWHYLNDPVAVACGDQFLLGRDLLVAPILRQGAVARSVYLPNDVWFNFWTGEALPGGLHHVVEAGLGTLPLFVRAGAVIPWGQPEQFVGELPTDTLTLQCWPGAEGALEWYEDDGATQAYEAGVWHRRTIRSRSRGRTFSLHFSAAEGPFPSRYTKLRVLLWGARRKGALTVNGRTVRGRWIREQHVFVAEFSNSPGEIQVEFTGL